MKRLPIGTRISLLLAETSTKVMLGFLAVILVILGAMAMGYVPDLWNSHGRGPGWECTSFGKGAYWCSKDVPPQFQHPKTK
jgi:hypothetical protein